MQIADSVASVGQWAFYHDPMLRELSLPAAVSEIGDRAFYDCTALTDIRVDPENAAFRSADGALLTMDGTELVCYCPGRPQTSFTVPDGVKLIRPSAFSYTAALEWVDLPDSLEEIGNWAFGHTGLRGIVLPESVRTVRYCAFSGTPMETAALPASLSLIEEYVFGERPLAHVCYWGTRTQWDGMEITDDNEALLGAALHLISGSRILLPEQLTVIGEEAFAGGSFTQVYLKPSVTEIGKRAFADCAQLAFIRIPASCAAIAADAFEGCGDTVIACAADSPAYRYAAEHGMAYLIVN